MMLHDIFFYMPRISFSLSFCKRAFVSISNIGPNYAKFHSTSSSIMANTRMTTLSNGVRVVTEYLNVPSSTVGIWMDIGSRYETPRNHGIAHFLERLVGRGLIGRNDNHVTDGLNGLIDRFRSNTTRDCTFYSVHCLQNENVKAIELLAEMILHPKLDSSMLHICRSILLQEKLAFDKRMEEVAMDHLHSVAFQGSPLARPVLGSDETIANLQKKDFEDFIRKYAVGEKIILVGAGSIQHDDMVTTAEKCFGHLPSKTNYMKPLAAYYTGADVRMRDDTMTNAHVVIAFQGPSFKSLDYFPLLIAQTVVGNWNRTLSDGYYLSSKLAQNVASEQLAHSFTSFNIPYADVGLWGIHLTSDKKYELDDLVYLVQQEWVRICINLTEGELERAKNQIKTQLMLGVNGTAAICQDIGSQMLMFGHRYSVDELICTIDRIDINTVKRVCTEYLYDRCPVVSAFGPIETVPDYNRIRSATLWLRV